MGAQSNPENGIFLSMFLRYSSEVLIFRIFDNKFNDLIYRKKIEPYYINDISFSEDNIFVCFDNSTVARIYPNDEEPIEDDEAEEEMCYNDDPMNQVE